MRWERLAALTVGGFLFGQQGCLMDWDVYKPSGATSAVQGSSSTGGDAAGGGGSTFCQPGDVKACYSGPANTQGVGICRAGTQTCAADGSGFGDCIGEILPAAEDCTTEEDDNCDGTPNEAPCGCAESSTVACYEGPAGTDGVGACQAGVQVCEAGLPTGACIGQIVPSAEECASPGDEDCDGQSNEGCPTAALRFGGGGNERVAAISFGLLGEQIIGGSFRSAVLSVDNISLTRVGGETGYVVYRSAQNTIATALEPAPTSGATVRLADIKSTSAGIFVLGSFTGGLLAVDGTTETSTTGAEAGFLLLLKPEGGLLWLKRIDAEASGKVIPRKLQVVGSLVMAAGSFQGTLLPPSPMPTPAAAIDDTDGWMAGFDAATGALQWSYTQDELIHDFVLTDTSSSNAYVVGQTTSSEDTDAYVAELRFNAGGFLKEQWRTDITGAGAQAVRRVVRVEGTPTVLLEIENSVSFGMGNTLQAQGRDLVLAEFSTVNGVNVKANVLQHFAQAGDQVCDEHCSLTYDSSSKRMAFAVPFSGSVSFGSPYTIASLSTLPDWALVTTNQAGKTVDVRRFGGLLTDEPSVVASSSGKLLLAGTCDGGMTVGTDLHLPALTSGNDDVCMVEIDLK